MQIQTSRTDPLVRASRTDRATAHSVELPATLDMSLRSLLERVYPGFAARDNALLSIVATSPPLPGASPHPPILLELTPRSSDSPARVRASRLRAEIRCHAEAAHAVALEASARHA